MRPEPWTATEYNERLLVPVGAVTLDMERHGVPVDCVALREIEADMAAAGTRLRGELNQWTAGRDVNWNSWQQLASWLHDAEADGGLGLEPSPYWKKGRWPAPRGRSRRTTARWSGSPGTTRRTGRPFRPSASYGSASAWRATRVTGWIRACRTRTARGDCTPVSGWPATTTRDPGR